MKKLSFIVLCLLLPFLLFTACPEDNPSKQNQTQDENQQGQGPQDTVKHEKPYVSGANLVDKDGNKLQLYGMSTHGIAWYPDYVNFETFKTLHDDWKTNCIRLAMYTAESGGYCSGGDKENLKKIIKKGVDAAIQLGMYVIIDWHVLNENPSKKPRNGDPNFYKKEAKISLMKCLNFIKTMKMFYMRFVTNLTVLI